MLYTVKNLVLVFGLVLFGMYLASDNKVIKEVVKRLFESFTLIVVLTCISVTLAIVDGHKADKFDTIDRKRISAIEDSVQLEKELESLKSEYNKLKSENNDLKEELKDKEDIIVEENNDLKDVANDLKDITVKESDSEEVKEEVEEVEEPLEYSKEEIRSMMNKVNLISTRIHKAKRSGSYVDMTSEVNQLDSIYQEAETQRDKYVFKNNDVACAYSSIMTKIEILKQIIPCYDQSEYDTLSLQEAKHGADFNDSMNNLK